jgi:hypothetical protein
MFDPNELQITGLTYHMGFSRYSEDVHAISYDLQYGDAIPINFDKAVNLLSTFAIILFRNMSVLLQVESLDWIKKIGVHLDNTLEGDKAFLSRLTYQPEIEIGDFVLVRDRLTLVKNIKESEYKFRSFEVFFLQEPFVPEITEDWIAPWHLELFQKKSKVKEGVLAEMEKMGLAFNNDVGTIDDQNWDKYIRLAVIRLYNDLRASLGNSSPT